MRARASAGTRPIVRGDQQPARCAGLAAAAERGLRNRRRRPPPTCRPRIVRRRAGRRDRPPCSRSAGAGRLHADPDAAVRRIATAGESSISIRRCCRHSPACIRIAARCEAGCKLAGATVHFVTPELDHGPIIAQAMVPVLAGDDEDSLAAAGAAARAPDAAARGALAGRRRIDRSPTASSATAAAQSQLF